MVQIMLRLVEHYDYCQVITDQDIINKLQKQLLYPPYKQLI